MNLAVRFLRLAWASPYSLGGLLLGLAALALGGRARRVAGALEFGGGRLGAFAAKRPGLSDYPVITLGHVVLGVDEASLAAFRDHERVHVRQYERWGPLFCPAYALSSLAQAVRGRDPYFANRFEREAYAAGPPRRDLAAPSA